MSDSKPSEDQVCNASGLADVLVVELHVLQTCSCASVVVEDQVTHVTPDTEADNSEVEINVGETETTSVEVASPLVAVIIKVGETETTLVYVVS